MQFMNYSCINHLVLYELRGNSLIKNLIISLSCSSTTHNRQLNVEEGPNGALAG